MLAQSLFALAVPAAQADQPASQTDDGGAFGRLVDQAVRPEPGPLPATWQPAARGPQALTAPTSDMAGPKAGMDAEPQVLPQPVEYAAKAKLVDGEGPQILPDVSKPAEGEGPQILPGEPPVQSTRKTVFLQPEVLPAEPDALPSATTEARADPTTPQLLPISESEVPASVDAEQAKSTEDADGIEVQSARTAPTPETPPARSTENAEQTTTRRGPAERVSHMVVPEDVTPDAAHSPSGIDAPKAPGLAKADGEPSGPSVQTRTAPDMPPPRVAEPQRSDPAAAAPAALDAPAPGSSVDAPKGEPLAFGLSRVAHATIADLSAQIVRRLEGKFTRFDMALTPEDLGRVDVSLEMGEDGSLTARLAFDTPAAAAEMRSRADELRRQLEQAGFQLAKDSLEFSQRDGSSGRHEGFERRSGRAFAAARDLADQVEAAPIHLALSLNPTHDRVDVKV
jgi:flagellar hook-length control protein FliK